MNVGKTNSCLICGSKTKGLHLQVFACRPCAEFFRRSIQMKKVYRCMLGTRKCDLLNWSKDRRLCRYCRFQKCKEIGMNLESSVSKNEQKNEPKTEEQIIENSTSIEKEENQYLITIFKDVTSNAKITIDASALEEVITQIFYQTHANPIFPELHLTFMQTLLYGFYEFFEKSKPKNSIIISTEFDLPAALRHQEKFLLDLTKIFMYCEQFATLNSKDKTLLVKNSWRQIYQFERIFSSIQYFGYTIDDSRILFDDTTAIEYTRMKKPKEMGEEIFNKSQILWINFHRKLVNLLVNPMKNLKLTAYELVYIIAQNLWHIHDNEPYTEQCRLLSEEVLEQTSSELHRYYIYEKNVTNYAHRLVKITKLVESARVVLEAKKDVFMLAKICDLFDCDNSKSELFG